MFVDKVRIVFVFILLECLTHQLAFAAQEENTCRSDELNHSRLVVCNEDSRCNSGASPEWPNSADKILLIQSTRLGDRLVPKILDNLWLREDENTRLLNINTTVYVQTNGQDKQKLGRGILGFGATLDMNSLSSESSRDDSRWLAPILEDLFGQTSSSLNLNLLRLSVPPRDRQTIDISKALSWLDDEIFKLHKSDGQTPVLVLLDFMGKVTDFSQSINEIVSLTRPLNKLKTMMVAIDGVNSKHDVDEIRRLLPRDSNKLLLSESAKSLIENDKSVDDTNRSQFDGTLLKWGKSVPYNILDSFKSWGALLTVGSHLPMTREYGDWQNARNFAVELLNLLKYGSEGFIQGLTFSEALRNDLGGDCSIYSVQKEHGTHFRSPIYYALSHFSRYLKPGSTLLPMDVFTQPNMFAANYIAFMTPDSQHIVAIILNDNEHLLPFRLAVDNVVMAHAYLEPKSFNTLIIKRVDQARSQ